MSSRHPTAKKRALEFDIVLVGGGLQNGLLTLGALARQPDLRIALVEAAGALGGNHTWCVHGADAPASGLRWMDPLIVHRWRGYDVRFPRLSRTLCIRYDALTSERFDSVVRSAIDGRPGSACFLNRRATRIADRAVDLDDGMTLTARLVVDARGPTLEGDAERCGFQKFVGLELELDRPHHLERPVLMDATVPQTGGFRFFYVLPFGTRRLLVEDTRFSVRPDLAEPVLRGEVLAYASRFGAVTRVLREEAGVLPMPWQSRSVEPVGSPLVAGYRGGWFHPGTGYSTTAAIRLACHVAERAPAHVFDGDLTRLYRAHRRQARFAEHLNRLLFRCFPPDEMRNVFERFYALPEALIARFHALSSTWTDRARILGGRPPRGFSLLSALASARTA